MLAARRKLPVDFTIAIYYVGPVDPVRDELSPGRPTGTRWKVHRDMLAKPLIAMIARGTRPVAIGRYASTRPLISSPSGPAYLVAKAIRNLASSRSPSGHGTVYEFEVRDMRSRPVDANGESLHSRALRSGRARSLAECRSPGVTSIGAAFGRLCGGWSGRVHDEGPAGAATAGAELGLSS